MHFHHAGVCKPQTRQWQQQTKVRTLQSNRTDAMFTATSATLAEIRARGRKVVRRNGKQILLILADERVFAIANRCPHEGYPLSEGTLSSGYLLTCNWHNWKLKRSWDTIRCAPIPWNYEMRTSSSISRIRQPRRSARALNGLDAAMADNDMARMAREMARLER